MPAGASRRVDIQDECHNDIMYIMQDGATGTVSDVNTCQRLEVRLVRPDPDAS